MASSELLSRNPKAEYDLSRGLCTYRLADSVTRGCVLASWVDITTKTYVICSLLFQPRPQTDHNITLLKDHPGVCLDGHSEKLRLHGDRYTPQAVIP